MSGSLKSDGGPAFPTLRSHQGMSLRDWFAGQALAGFVAVDDMRTFDKHCGQTIEEWRSMLIREDAEHLYEIADAMLKAREASAILTQEEFESHKADQVEALRAWDSKRREKEQEAC